MQKILPNKDRKYAILDYIIREYIVTAEPVSSGYVSESADFDVSPATIRNAMNELDEEGYLFQPYTSAGRVPTDKAYRYFVNLLFERGLPVRNGKNIKEFDIGDIFEDMEAARGFVQILARKLKLFTVIGSYDYDELFFQAGMSEIFNEPELGDPDVAKAFAEVFENIPKLIDYFQVYKGSGPKVVIGKENPFRFTHHFSSIIARPDESTIVFLTGPKRMDYERATSVMRELLN